MSKQKGITLEAGSSSEGKIWIGAPDECYDVVIKPFSKKQLHILLFTIPQAEAVIEMLNNEIERMKDESNCN
jgi:hypothetical protein